MTGASDDAQPGVVEAGVAEPNGVLAGGLVVVGDPAAGVCEDGVCAVPQGTVVQRNDAEPDSERVSRG